jgi:hypothetical protein
MSEGYHIHGAHDHAMEHAVQGGEKLAQKVALLSALLASFGAVVSYMGSYTQTEAMMHKNEAVLNKAHASDQWSFYQSKSTKEHLVRLAADNATNPERRTWFLAEAERYKKEKEEIKHQAEALDEKSQHENELSDKAMHPHHRLAQAMTLIQVAIGLASITVLTARRWLFWAALTSAVASLVLVATALV